MSYPDYFSGCGWRIEIGDCVSAMSKWNSQPDLIFADPPFNIGQEYNDGNSDVNDSVSESDYWRFFLNWVKKAWSVLRHGGVFAIHVPTALLRDLHEIETLVAMGKPVASLIWHYRFGQCHRSNWINSHCHLEIYHKPGGELTWNPEDVLVDSDRKRMGDKRIAETENGGSRVPFSVWGIPSDGKHWGRVQGNSKQRRPMHPNQLPEKYLERIIRAYTNPFDVVADPFTGSGTTGVVAVALGRNFLGCEILPGYAESAADRMRRGPVTLESVV